MNPRYPIYIPSLGRWDSRLTVKILTRLRVPFKICVEPSEYDRYAAVIPTNTILVLPEDFSKRRLGSIPARNWIWEHAIAANSVRHWIIDDNIVNFYRLNRNRRIPVGSGTIFRCAEDFTDRYENVAFSGFNNIAFAPDRSSKIAPFTLNTRIYSITLINNAFPERWRGPFNEDTDICIRALKANWVTIQFNAFLADKATTMKMRGGNTDTIYAAMNNRLEFAESLQRQHPDVASVVWKFNRWHHHVDYSVFKKNKLRPRDGLEISSSTNEYGMKLVKVSGDEA